MHIHKHRHVHTHIHVFICAHTYTHKPTICLFIFESLNFCSLGTKVISWVYLSLCHQEFIIYYRYIKIKDLKTTNRDHKKQINKI